MLTFLTLALLSCTALASSEDPECHLLTDKWECRGNGECSWRKPRAEGTCGMKRFDCDARIEELMAQIAALKAAQQPAPSESEEEPAGVTFGECNGGGGSISGISIVHNGGMAEAAYSDGTLVGDVPFVYAGTKDVVFSLQATGDLDMHVSYPENNVGSSGCMIGYDCEIDTIAGGDYAGMSIGFPSGDQSGEGYVKEEITINKTTGKIYLDVKSFQANTGIVDGTITWSYSGICNTVDVNCPCAP